MASDSVSPPSRNNGEGGTGYRNPALTVDGVVLLRHPSDARGASFSVLLVERGNEPFRGMYALPGGFVDYGEDIEDAIHREIEEETGLSGLSFRQFQTFGHPDRDPRGHTVSIVYVGLIAGPTPEVTGGDDAASAAWFPVTELPELAFDHARILSEVLAAQTPG